MCSHVFHYDRIATRNCDRTMTRNCDALTRKNSSWRYKNLHYASIRHSFSSFSVPAQMQLRGLIVSCWWTMIVSRTISLVLRYLLTIARHTHNRKSSLCQSHFLTVHTSSDFKKKKILQNNFSFLKNFVAQWCFLNYEKHFVNLQSLTKSEKKIFLDCKNIC